MFDAKVALVARFFSLYYAHARKEGDVSYSFE
jgi:hypothetical protein